MQVLNHKFLKPEGGLLVATGAREVSIWFADIAVRMDAASKLGEGAGGQVFSGTWCGRAVAVKKVKAGQEAEALQEAKLGRWLHTPRRHPHVLMMWGVTLRGGITCTVTEAMALRGLNEWAWRGSPHRQRLRVADVAELELQAAQGLARMHELGFAHRDVAGGPVSLPGGRLGYATFSFVLRYLLRPPNTYLLRASGISGVPQCVLHR